MDEPYGAIFDQPEPDSPGQDQISGFDPIRDPLT
jgi:hypothetical protein